MNEPKCKRCGASLAHGTAYCPSCGSMTEQASTEYAAPSAKPKKKVNVKSIISIVMSLVSLVLGFVIINMGKDVMDRTTNFAVHEARFYNVAGLKFGGDFYTEIYKASDVIVDELNDINTGIESLSKSISKIPSVVYYPVGMLICAIGIAVIAMSCNHLIVNGVFELVGKPAEAPQTATNNFSPSSFGATYDNEAPNAEETPGE